MKKNNLVHFKTTGSHYFFLTTFCRLFFFYNILPLSIALEKSEITQIFFFFNSTLPVFSSAQSLSHVWLFVTPWTATCQASLSITNSWSLLKLMSIESVMPSNHLILCLPVLGPLKRLFDVQRSYCHTWSLVTSSRLYSVLTILY